MDFFYTTEYQRSFLSHLQKNIIPKVSKEKRLSYQHEDKNSPRETNKSCSIGVQANLNNQHNRKVQFDLEPKSIKKTKTNGGYEEPLTPRRTTGNESLDTRKPKKEFVPEKPSKGTKPIEKSDEKPVSNPADAIERYSSFHPQHQLPYSLDLVAGNESQHYHRAPFIQSKKRVENPCTSNASVYRVSSEPCLQKKRITLYPKNHNILRTSTVEEEETPRTNERPSKYVSSYNLDYHLWPFRHQSPIMNVEYTMNMKNTSDSVRSAIYEFDDTNKYYKRNYEKGNYETEYQQYFKRKDSEEMSSPILSAANDNKDFLDYYKQVLNKRVIAYAPSLLDKYATPGRQSSPDQKTSSPRNEKKQQREEKEPDRPSPRYQNYVKGRYTREYNPELYSP